MLALILCCWAALWHSSAAVESSRQQPPFSASLLYVYAKDSDEWSGLTGKQLRANDTLLIRPGVVYKVWCEVLPEGWPRIRSSIPNVIAYQPRPLNTMAHVELERDLINTLKSLKDSTKPAKLWCDYNRGDERLQIEVSLKPLVSADTACNFSTAAGLAVEGSSVNFTCTSNSGYPQPQHRCELVRAGSGFRQAARVVSVTNLGLNAFVTTFSVPVSKDNQNASIECSVQQSIAFNSFTESFNRKVFPTGFLRFIFASESTKNCTRVLKGDFGVIIRCQSEGGFPETEHRCWKTDTVEETEVAPFMAKDASYITEMAFNNTWADQGGTVTCVLRQGRFYAKRFSLRIPDFKQSVKNCTFSRVKGGLQVTCFTGRGLPPSRHGCTVRSNSTEAQLLMSNQTSCRFTKSLWEVRATCEFSSGNPATSSNCQLLVANSSVKLTLQPESEQQVINEANELSSSSYLVRLPGPNASHAGGNIVCRVHQDNLFVKTFVYRISKPNATKEEEFELRVSSQTVITLSLALVVAMLLVLLMSLPIHSLRRCLGRKSKYTSAALCANENEVESTVQLTETGAKPTPHRTETQTPAPDEYEIVNFRHGGYRRRDDIPDIDQISMFECGYSANLSNANKRKSVLADALVLCQADLERRDHRFSV
uniref:Ig-like domain-containing protein n=1 Tax=Macrostomum lignano TaxID=282301 RepID=A0A1I8HRG2_9PLAT